MGTHDLTLFPKPVKCVFFSSFCIIYMNLDNLALKTRFFIILMNKQIKYKVKECM